MERKLLNCSNCGEELNDNGFEVVGKRYISGLPEKLFVCNFQCLTEWDCTGPGLKGNQGFNLNKIKLIPFN